MAWCGHWPPQLPREIGLIPPFRGLNFHLQRLIDPVLIAHDRESQGLLFVRKEIASSTSALERSIEQ
jgi:hypothetical protein